MENASKELRSNKEVVFAEVAKNGMSLEFVSRVLRADKEVVLASVKQDGHALAFASKELRGDKVHPGRPFVPASRRSLPIVRVIRCGP